VDIESLIYPIEVKNRQDIIKIKPLMDLHYGAKACDLRAFKNFISNGDEFTYYLINGDMWDAIYFSDTKRFAASGSDKTDQDDPIDNDVKEMAAILEPIKGKIIAVGMGNHEYQVLKRHHTNLSKRLADALGVPYMGYSYWIRLQMTTVSTTEARGQGRTIDFFIQHGFGGGTRTEGGSVTKYAKHADRFLCDVYIAGHDHRLQYVRYPVLALSGSKQAKLISKSKIVLLGGSWLKTYNQGTSTTYSELKGYPPGEIGGATIHIKTTDDWVKITVDM
jgi:predicted phosphodiesterase